MNSKPRLIVIEGLDGSGKATQSDILLATAQNNGKKARKISFPDYNSKSSALVKMYLDGEIGTLEDVNVYAASNFYSLDRYISYNCSWKEDYLNNVLIISDRYTTSNICHQMTRLPEEKWESYIKWLTDYEYNMLGLPEPATVIYLDMHPDVSRVLLSQRYKGDESKKDLLEQNFAYQLKCREAALFAAKKLNWIVINCFSEDKKPLSIEVIAEQVLKNVENFWG